MQENRLDFFNQPSAVPSVETAPNIPDPHEAIEKILDHNAFTLNDLDTLNAHGVIDRAVDSALGLVGIGALAAVLYYGTKKMTEGLRDKKTKKRG